MGEPLDRLGGVLAVAWTRYLEKLEKEPLKTKAITAAVLAGLSDIIAQKLAAKAPVNWRRTAAMAAFGGIWSGPSNHFWQGFVERVFRGRSGPTLLIQKVGLDQVTYGPLCNILLMTYVALVVEGRSVTFTKAKLWQDYPGVQLNAWKVWPTAANISYTHIPIRLRVLFANVVGLFWNTFLILRSRTALMPASSR